MTWQSSENSVTEYSLSRLQIEAMATGDAFVIGFKEAPSSACLHSKKLLDAQRLDKSYTKQTYWKRGRMALFARSRSSSIQTTTIETSKQSLALARPFIAHLKTVQSNLRFMCISKADGVISYQFTPFVRIVALSATKCCHANGTQWTLRNMASIVLLLGHSLTQTWDPELMCTGRGSPLPPILNRNPMSIADLNARGLVNSSQAIRKKKLNFVRSLVHKHSVTFLSELYGGEASSRQVLHKC